ncbi:protein of unknown function [Serratia sp. Tan611]|nr:protein of unknown function [Serratia sp. Tan611]
MVKPVWRVPATVHCRTGSLENGEVFRHGGRTVHCRTGSLEKDALGFPFGDIVHCRTGSLENQRCI